MELLVRTRHRKSNPKLEILNSKQIQMTKIRIFKTKNFPIMSFGFTLIELLVVISIIGLLAGLVISNVAGVRERARDVERKSDLDQIKKALRMYYNDYNSYPASIPTVGDQFSVGSMIYMKLIPKDPVSNQPYTYTRGTCTEDFRLVATLENKSDSGIDKSQDRCSEDTCGAPAAYAEGSYVVCAD